MSSDNLKYRFSILLFGKRLYNKKYRKVFFCSSRYIYEFFEYLYNIIWREKGTTFLCWIRYSSASRGKKIINNIVFIGSIGWTNNSKKDFLNCKNQEEFTEFIKKFNNETNLCDPKNVNKDYLFVSTSNKRIKTLDALSDLGLKVHGQKYNFVNALPYSMDLIKCFDFKMVYSCKDVQDVYNSSLIAPNLGNGQSLKGVSWRVLDVMASNACLISSPAYDLSIISQYVKIPIFETPQEARNLCKKLIKDELWRREIVSAAQYFVNKSYRFIDLLQIIEKFTKIVLIAGKIENQFEKYLIIDNNKLYFIKTILNFLVKGKAPQLIRNIFPLQNDSDRLKAKKIVKSVVRVKLDFWLVLALFYYILRKKLPLGRISKKILHYLDKYENCSDN